MKKSRLIIASDFLWPFYRLKTLCAISMITWLLLSVTVLQIQAKDTLPSERVSLVSEIATVKDILKEIERQTDFRFFYNHQRVDVARRISINLRDVSIPDALNEIFKNASIGYKISGSHILLFALDEANADPAASMRLTMTDTGVRYMDALFGVSGTVTDESGESMPGVNIIEKGSTNGTITDATGRYSLVTRSADAVLVFSSVGYTTQEVAIAGRSVIDVVMIADVKALSEVVVTAFGIEKEKKALSYSVQEVDGAQLSAVGNTNLVNSLQGKIAGVIVKQTSGAPGSRSLITIRGSRSLVGNNEPLYVVDGLPVSSGGRTIDINPNDVKSINVLKGPTAAALYGLRASNGVIVIETKKGEGSPEGKPSVNFETSYNFDQLSRYPDTQTTYAQGERGKFNAFSAFAWGPRIDTMGTYTNQLGEQEQAAVYDNTRDMFQTGGTFNANLSLTNAFDRGNYALSLGVADQTGIIDNSGMQRVNVKVAGGYDLSEKLRIGTSINYANTVVDQLSLPWWATFAVPPSYNLKGKPTHVPGDPYKQINFRGQHDNFYWAMKHNYAVDKISRLFGNVNIDYKPLEWLSVNYRVGLDEYTARGKDVEEKGSGSGRTDPPSGGVIANNMGYHRQINSNLNVTMTRRFGEGLALDFMVGNEFYDIQSRSLVNRGSDIVIGGFHHISNTAIQTTSENFSHSRVVGFFGNLSLSWMNAVFLNATGRNDIVSNMPRQNRSFFYPSLGLGVVVTEFVTVPENILTFAKLRASVAEVGQAGPIYSTATLYTSGAATGGFTFPYNGMNAFTQSGALNSSDLRPENTQTFEIGVDLRFLNDRIGLDYTYYDSRANGQIYRVPIAASTGFTSELRNAGEMSIKGHEVTLNLTPVSTPSFQWELTTNFTSYTNKVISLAEGIDQLDLGGFWVRLVAKEGEEYPSIRGIGYARDPATGEVVVDSRATLANGNPNTRYGMPLRTTEEVILGSAQPDFDMGFINSFTYKNISLSAQIDWRQGGKMSSGYNRLGKLYGILAETEDREADYVYPGMKGYYEEGNLVVVGDNDISIKRGYDFYRVNQDPIREASVYDATFVRLREIRLSYDLPKAWLGKSLVRSASFYLVGRNLWLNAAVPNFDPEMFNTTEGESYNTYPQTKSYGAGLRINL